MIAVERTISIGQHKLQVPALFASYRLGDCPTSGLCKFPWAMTRTEAVLINAYDFTQRKYEGWLNNGWDPANYLNFAHKPVMIDSGAYYFLRDSKISVTPTDVLGIHLKAKADVGVALDHPFPPDAADKAARISRTIRNTELALRVLASANTKMTFMPVIHGHTRQSIRGCIQRIRRLADKYQLPILNHVGIGSLAPLAKRGEARLAVDVIQAVRQELPDSQIHCFSMGSALLMLLAFYSGADSVDSQTWMVSAGFKLAQLPGHYVLRMGKREYSSIQKFNGAMRRFANRLAHLAVEEDFAVKDWHTGSILNLRNRSVRSQYVDNLIDLTSNENVHNRACHNLWVYNFEVRSYRDAARRGKVDSFIESRLRGTRYDQAFAHARRLHTQ